MRRRTYNEVPPETIIRQMAKERGKLLAEIDYLKSEIERRDRAIAAFKKWQAKVAEYKWEYWLHQGIELMDTPPDKHILRTLINLLGAHRIFEEWQHKVTHAWETYKTCQEKARKVLKVDTREDGE